MDQINTFLAPRNPHFSTYCCSGLFGDCVDCHRRTKTIICFQHYPQIQIYTNKNDLETAIKKLLYILKQLADPESQVQKERSEPKASVGPFSNVIFHAIVNLIALNKWYLQINPRFYQITFQKYMNNNVAKHEWLKPTVIHWQWIFTPRLLHNLCIHAEQPYIQ